MPLDDYVQNAAPSTTTPGSTPMPQKGKTNIVKGKKPGQKDEILINPDYKELVREDSKAQSIIERVVSLQQRRAKAIQMRKNASRLKRSREISRLKPASTKQLTRRSFKIAKQNIRRRVVGPRAMEYQTLGPSEKVAIDRIVDPKVKHINVIAKRIFPRVKQADAKRLQAARTGKAYRVGNIPQMNSVDMDVDKFNQLYEMVFRPEQSKDLNESFGAFYTARDLGIVAEGGFAFHPSVYGMIDENVNTLIRQATIAQRDGRFAIASHLRKMASAYARGDMTTVKALRADLPNIKE